MSNKSGAVLVILIGLFVTLTCKRFATTGNENSSNARVNTSRAFTAEGKDWRSFDLKDTDMKVDFPGTPADKSPQLPAAYKTVFSAARLYAYDDEDFQSSATELVPNSTRNFSIKILADTSMAAIKRQMPNLTYSLDIRSDTNAKISGSYSRNGKTYDVRGCCVFKKTKPARVWEVLALFPSDNADAQSAGQRIIESAVFKESSETCK
jgi:hypothetical protein